MNTIAKNSENRRSRQRRNGTAVLIICIGVAVSCVAVAEKGSSMPEMQISLPKGHWFLDPSALDPVRVVREGGPGNANYAIAFEAHYSIGNVCAYWIIRRTNTVVVMLQMSFVSQEKSVFSRSDHGITYISLGALRGQEVVLSDCKTKKTVLIDHERSLKNLTALPRQQDTSGDDPFNPQGDAETDSSHDDTGKKDQFDNPFE